MKKGFRTLVSGALLLLLSYPGGTATGSTGYPLLLYSHTYTMKRISPLEQALRTGNASLTTETALWNEAKEAIQDYDDKRKQALITLLKLDSNGNPTAQSLTSIDWNPSHDSVWFDSAQLDKSFPLLISNDSAKKDTSSHKTLAMAGFIGKARFAALGANPFH
ncbi:MAG: hypothetical protein D3910_27770, partial [Candidatus Electrothrix sp. ATG2]|nr:hypothetical protein [Candidatus Electrothrix sp. ATG2]